MFSLAGLVTSSALAHVGNGDSINGSSQRSIINSIGRLQDKDSLMDRKEAQEEPEGRPGGPGRGKDLGGNP